MESATVCRSCLSRDAAVDVSTACGGTSLGALLALCAGVGADESAALPRRVCVACRALLLRFREFGERARRADAALRRHLATGGPLPDCDGLRCDWQGSETTPANSTARQEDTKDEPRKGKGKRKKLPPWKKQDVTIATGALEECPGSPAEDDDSDMDVSLSTLSSRTRLQLLPERIDDTCLVKPSDENDRCQQPSAARAARARGGRWVCEACGYRAADRCSLRVHRRFHTGERPFCCLHCPKAFAISANLKAHLRVHSGERPFVCEWCGRALSTAASLRGHVRVHTGERPFACGACPRAFALRSNLRQHARVHSGEKPYACETCGKRSSSSSDARAHRRTHTGERPHACAACPRRFALASNLRAHRRTHAASPAAPAAATHRPRHLETSHPRQQRQRRGSRAARGEGGARGARRHACDACGKSFARKSSLSAHKKRPTACAGAGGAPRTSEEAPSAPAPAPTSPERAPLGPTNRSVVIQSQQIIAEGKLPVAVGQPPHATIAFMQIGGGALVCAAPLPVTGAPYTLMPLSVLR